MAKFVFNFLFLSLSLLVALTMMSTTTATILSCSDTPYPDICSSSLHSSNSRLSPDKSAASFRDLVLRATMDRAMHATESALATVDALGPLDASAEAAWSDCLELAQDTVALLNRSASASSSDEDAQTWLSAAMANQQACRDGFTDLSSSYSSASAPFVSGNLTESISNSLAVNNNNKPAVRASTGGTNRRRLLSDGFPGWVSAADRKLLGRSSGAKANADLVVAKDGSGDYKTVTEALAASAKRRKGTSRFVIYVKAGVYSEYVQVTRSMTNILMVGDGAGATVVTGSRSVQDGYTTFKSATFAVVGAGFIAQDMTFENTAGPQKHQAVAFRSGSDRSVYYRCSFKGYQDTLYVYSQRQFYRECDIYGTVDFIFGDAVAVLQGCNIYIRKPMAGQKNTVTAQGRSDPNENTGISIHESAIAAAPELRAAQGSFRSYLGRPWKQYSRTVVARTSIDGVIDPAGWLEWSGNFALRTLYYGEYMNSGSGSGTGRRVKWPGYRVIASTTEAGKFTVGSFLSGGSWIPATGVPFTSGLN